MKKTTLKHRQPNGVLATRTTSRPYTHVLLRAYNPAARIAALESALPALLAQVEEDSRYDYARFLEGKAAGVGGLIRWHRDSGGYRTYGQNATRPQTSYEYELAVKYLTDYPTVEAYVAHTRETELKSHARSVAIWKKESSDFEVISWHSRAALAEPQYPHLSDRYLVEAINGGTR